MDQQYQIPYFVAPVFLVENRTYVLFDNNIYVVPGFYIGLHHFYISFNGVVLSVI
ncbi:hypothetical protein RhiirC2_739184 [Rhizophagus irregularis]|uniref:Uncharacterized protein n=1 Tax=Rhizophagus irregularis TaxID=588596 RepID=A0A2N1NK82_9GLOM|nr:hypothetical protein RhiirC2_739184 [Rhizophagus irregularis]